MRQPSRLVVSPPSSRYASLHAEELNRLGLPLGSRLWKVASTSLVDDAASVHELLTPLLRAVDFKGLLQSLDASDAIDDAPWTLRYENHGNGQADERAQTYLNAIAFGICGPSRCLRARLAAKARATTCSYDPGACGTSPQRIQPFKMIASARSTCGHEDRIPLARRPICCSRVPPSRSRCRRTIKMILLRAYDCA